MLDIYTFIYHIQKCPFEFKSTSKIHRDDGLDTNALLMDVLRKINPSLEKSLWATNHEKLKKCEENHLISVHIACWFLNMEFFQNRSKIVEPVKEFLFEHLKLLNDFVKPDEWIEDIDRAEEMARGVLHICNITPAGETEFEAKDQWEAISTLKRNNVLVESKASFDRVAEIRRKMAQEKAREAANVYGRE